jgi:hypothetical protein
MEFGIEVVQLHVICLPELARAEPSEILAGLRC